MLMVWQQEEEMVGDIDSGRRCKPIKNCQRRQARKPSGHFPTVDESVANAKTIVEALGYKSVTMLSIDPLRLKVFQALIDMASVQA